MPITWRNIGNLNNAAANSLLDRSASRVLGSFDDFNKAINSNLENKTQVAEGKIKTNTQRFEDALANYRSPEQLQSDIDSGAVDSLRASFGNYIDPTVARDGARNQLTNLRTEGKADFDYSQALYEQGERVREQQELPIIRDARAFINAKEFNKARTLLAGYPELSERAELQEAIIQGERGEQEFNFNTRAQTEQIEDMDRQDALEAGLGIASTLAKENLSEADGRRILADRLTENGVPTDLYEQIQSRFEDEYVNNRSLTNEQERLYASAQANFNRKVEEAENTYAQVTPEAFNAGRAMDAGDGLVVLQEQAAKNGADFTEIQRVWHNKVEEVNKATQDWPIELKQYLPQILYMTALKAGTDSRLGFKDLKPTAFDASFNSSVQQAIDSINAKKSLDYMKEVRDASLTNMSESMLTNNLNALTGAAETFSPVRVGEVPPSLDRDFGSTLREYQQKVNAEQNRVLNRNRSIYR